jgi:beta-galactosidase
VHYLEYANLTAPVPVSGTLSGAATGWADGLVPEGATVLAGYEHPHFGEFAAVTTNAHGGGRVTYVGTVPDRELSRTIAAWLTAGSLPPDLWRAAPGSSVRCTSADAGGRVLRFVHNWSWKPAELTLPGRAHDVLSGETVEALRLSAWDVRVLEELA